MYDSTLTQKICNLTCSKKDVLRSQETIKYDIDHPFEKYYSLATLKGAIEKLIYKEWDDKTFAHWACIYCWILMGGFDHDRIKEDLNTFEKFFRDFIVWDLDGLSFIDSEDVKTQEMQEWIALFENYDHIWNARNEWKAVYAMIGPFSKVNGEQYVLLINDSSKEYMIMYSEHLKNGYEDEYFKFVSKNEFISLADQLKNDGYTMLSCSEECYYNEINDLQ